MNVPKPIIMKSLLAKYNNMKLPELIPFYDAEIFQNSFIPAPQSAVPTARALFLSKYIRTGMMHGRFIRPNPIPSDKNNNSFTVSNSRRFDISC